MLMAGIQAPSDWLMEIFCAGKGGEDPSETLLSKHFTGQPEAQPEPQGPVVEGCRLWGSAVCVPWGGFARGNHSCMGGVERLSLGLAKTFQVSPPPQISQPL